VGLPMTVGHRTRPMSGSSERRNFFRVEGLLEAEYLAAQPPPLERAGPMAAM
jgi:hypothetical protein